MIPMYKWFPGTNGSLVLMVPMYKWFPDTNGSQVQMVPRYKWFPGSNGSQYQNMTYILLGTVVRLVVSTLTSNFFFVIYVSCNLYDDVFEEFFLFFP
jgi:hypothetical protein